MDATSYALHYCGTLDLSSEAGIDRSRSARSRRERETRQQLEALLVAVVRAAIAVFLSTLV